MKIKLNKLYNAGQSVRCFYIIFNGGPGRIRTDNLLGANESLFQLELQAHKVGLLSIKHPIGSEFHIITHNGLIYLIVVGFIIAAAVRVFSLLVGCRRTPVRFQAWNF